MKFDEIANVPPQQLAPICLKFPVEELSKALVNSSPELTTGILKHISPNFADMIRDMIEKHGQLPAAEIESAREMISAIVEKSIAK